MNILFQQFYFLLHLVWSCVFFILIAFIFVPPYSFHFLKSLILCFLGSICPRLNISILHFCDLSHTRGFLSWLLLSPPATFVQGCPHLPMVDTHFCLLCRLSFSVTCLFFLSCLMHSVQPFISALSSLCCWGWSTGLVYL
jgi:hypothetical protein